MLREWMFAAAILTLPTYALAQVRGAVQSGEPRSACRAVNRGVACRVVNRGLARRVRGRAVGGTSGATGGLFNPDVPNTPVPPPDQDGEVRVDVRFGSRVDGALQELSDVLQHWSGAVTCPASLT